MPNLINRTGAEEVVMVGDATGSALVTETDFSIAGFPSVGSCLSDLPQQVAGFTNRFQVIAANITRGGQEYLLNLTYMDPLLLDL